MVRDIGHYCFVTICNYSVPRGIIQGHQVSEAKTDQYTMDFNESDDYTGTEEEAEDTQKSLSSYSDLFAAISFIFLFLFVIGSIQGGVQSMVSQWEKQKEDQKFREEMKEVVAKYEKILASYQTDKDIYLNHSATDEELKLYKESLEKLEIFEEEKSALKDKHKALSEKYATSERMISSFTESLKQIIQSNMVIKKQMAETTQVKDDLQENLQNYKDSAQAKYEKDFKTKLAQMEQKTAAEIKHTKDDLKVKSTQEIATIKEKTKLDYEKNLKNLLQEKDKLHQSDIMKHEHMAEAMSEQLETKKNQIAMFERKLEMNGKNASEAIGFIADKIADGLEKANIKAHVDRETGEVTLNFEKAYFELGKHELKKDMIMDLKRVIPVYAATVLNDPAIAERIESLEIIGYSSPIFAAKYVNPQKLNGQNYFALNYNLDLSYRRARSIFQYIFHPNEMNFPEKEKMFKITKVSGRSYLEGRVPADANEKNIKMADYCKRYNCADQQKAVIKFTLKY